MQLTPEERQRIYEEEKARIEAQIEVEGQTMAERAKHAWKPWEVAAVVISVLVLLSLLAGPLGLFARRIPPTLGGPVVTSYEFSRIVNGMSYRQVVDIIGAEGELISSGHLEGVAGIMEDVDTVMYQWVNPDGSNMNAMFQNDRLINKAQLGLR